MTDMKVVRDELVAVLSRYKLTLAETVGVMETLKIEVCLGTMNSRVLMEKIKRDLGPGQSGGP